jgi:hypothetical protein
MLKYIRLVTFLKRGFNMNIQKYRVNDLIELKKTHPCGNTVFKVLRVGATMRIVCQGCLRDMEIDRIKLEKATKKIIESEVHYSGSDTNQ